MLVYISGPYSAASAEEVRHNVARAMEAARMVYMKGHIPIVPHLTHFLHLYWVSKDTRAPKIFWLKHDAHLLQGCDVILMLSGWSKSDGARQELAWARDLNISACFSVNELPTINRGGISP